MKRLLIILLLLGIVGCDNNEPHMNMVDEEPISKLNKTDLIPEELATVLTDEQKAEYIKKMEDGSLTEDWVTGLVGGVIGGMVLAEIIDEVGDLFEKKHKKKITQTSLTPYKTNRYAPQPKIKPTYEKPKKSRGWRPFKRRR